MEDPMLKAVPLAASLTILVAALGACSTPPPQGGPSQSSPQIVTNVHPYKAGSGTVQAIHATPAATASAGASAAPMQRLEIKMDDGTIQYVDTPSREFPRGTRIVLTEDRYIKRL
jgi:hypothetical protein